MSNQTSLGPRTNLLAKMYDKAADESTDLAYRVKMRKIANRLQRKKKPVAQG